MTPSTEQTELERVKAEVTEKVTALSAEKKKKVYAIVLQDTTASGKLVIGYAVEPDLTTQMRLIDKSQAIGVDISLEAAGQAMESLLLKEESDERISKANPVYWKGAAYTLQRFMGIAAPVFF